MFRTIGDRPSSWDSRMPPDLLRVNALLDDPDSHDCAPDAGPAGRTKMGDNAIRLVSPRSRYAADPQGAPQQVGQGWGYKAHVIGNDGSIVVDYGVSVTPSPKGSELLQAIERTTQRSAV